MMMKGLYSLVLEMRALKRRLVNIENKIELILSHLKDTPAVVRPVYVLVSRQKTLETLKNLTHKVTATELAAITGRTRAREAAILSEFYRQGLVSATMQGNKKLFLLKEEYRDKR